MSQPWFLLGPADEPPSRPEPFDDGMPEDEEVCRHREPVDCAECGA